ncbi:hypothetical protein OH738_40585 (plasmid) [Streptomyces hirsutus]|uniref:hypothetical protein n=1 Tax=Streptomyces hirsutus TaxID=35620 RepID=UPI002F9182FE|nr:hypothetical protein OH738_40585 [Streptomyces hirsutus]
MQTGGGTNSSPPADAACEAVRINNNKGAQGCFEKYGDRLWVKVLTSPYDRSAFAYLKWTNQLWGADHNSAGSCYPSPSSCNAWQDYRQGECHTAESGLWAICNKDFYENSTSNPAGSKGSRLAWQVCTEFSCGSLRITVNDG